MNSASNQAAAEIVERAREAERSGAARDAIALYDEALSLLASAGADEPSVLVADVLRWKATVHRDCGDLAEAERLYTHSAQVATDCGYAGGVAHATNCRGAVAQLRGHLDIAESLYKEAARLAGE